MPIYEFRCAGCGERFEELVAAATTTATCPSCGGAAERLLSPISPPSRAPRGPKARDSEARRVEREAARKERLAETKKMRARGEAPPPRRSPNTGSQS